MIPVKPSERDNTQKRKTCPEYTTRQVVIDNLPYIIMTLLGAALFIVGLNAPFWKWLSAGLYIFYSMVGAFWIMLFICPYCHYYGTRGCPCGYGSIAAKLRSQRNEDLFRKKFKRHIPIIYPVWMIPTIAGIVFLIQKFSTLVLVLLILFAIDAFIILPLVSRKSGCAECPQKDQCPWMTK
ncbi:hypothetical protein JW824_04605 [bacterium]|nr:hypothetical protein [bacterium]